MTTEILRKIVTDKFEGTIQLLKQTLTVSNKILVERSFDTINSDRLSMYKKNKNFNLPSSPKTSK